MLKLKHLLENVWFYGRNISKKMYTAGLVLFAGTVAVAVVMLGVNGFAGTNKVEHVIAYEADDDDQVEQETIEMNINDVQSEESLSSVIISVPVDESSLMHHKNRYPFAGEGIFIEESEETAETAGNTEEISVKLMREETEENSTERVLRASSNELGDSRSILSMKDYTALVRIVEAEATGEDLKGKVLIANVVLNRVESKRFPNTIYDVVHQKLNGKAQFSPIDDGRYYSVPITSTTEQAVEMALSGTDYSEGALFFVAKSLASEKAGSWFDRNLTFVFKHGVHSFYKY